MSGTTPSNPPASGSGTSGSSGPSLPPVSATRLKAAAAAPLTTTHGAHLETRTSQNWTVCSGVISAILQLNEGAAILSHDPCPSPAPADDWGAIQKKSKP